MLGVRTRRSYIVSHANMEQFISMIGDMNYHRRWILSDLTKFVVVVDNELQLALKIAGFVEELGNPDYEI